MSQSLKRKPDENEIPSGELNPLVNPLLAANMGRWAEVYFTTPLERREQAIQDLLRELAGSPAARSNSAPVIDIEKRKKPEARPATQEASALVICGACRHGNAAGQRFCGMCGVALPDSATGSAAHVSRSWPAGSATINQPTPTRTDRTLADPAPGNRPTMSDAKISAAKISAAPVAAKTIATATVDRKGPNGFGDGNGSDREVKGDSTTGHDDVFALRQRLSDNDLPSFAVEAESFPYRYRLSIGVVLAIVLGVLTYMAWHGTKGLSGGRQSALPSAVPADQSAPVSRPPENSASANPASQPAGSAPATSIPATSGPAAGNAPPASFSKHSRSPSRNPTRADNPKPPAARKSTESAASPEPASAQSGAEELATAEKYLNGSAGSARDSQAAAQWLWKAVGKGNLTATMTLSDLYLHGDGVPKSCDQGRLLLDVAAKKGVAAAAFRLRNLQAFGCD